MKDTITSSQNAQEEFLLIVQNGPQANQQFKIASGEHSIGRHGSNQIQLIDPRISSKHARITVEAGEVSIEDLDSSNGTFVNGQHIVLPVLLSPGDVIGISEDIHLLLITEDEAYEGGATRVDSLPAVQRTMTPPPIAPPPISSPTINPSANLPQPQHPQTVQPVLPDELSFEDERPKFQLWWLIVGAGLIGIVIFGIILFAVFGKKNEEVAAPLTLAPIPTVFATAKPAPTMASVEPTQDEQVNLPTNTIPNPQEPTPKVDVQVEQPQDNSENKQISSTLFQGLVAYYPLDGNAIDASGNDVDALVHGAGLTEDRFLNANSAYYLDGEDDFIFAQSEAFKSLTSNITISMWIKTAGKIKEPTSLLKLSNIQGYAFNATQACGFVFDDNLFGFNIYQINVGTNVFLRQELASDRWHHIVGISENGTNLKIYLDTILVNSTTYGKELTDLQYLFIGGWVGKEGEEFPEIYIDDIYIYNRVLDISEIRALFEQHQ